MRLSLSPKKYALNLVSPLKEKVYGTEEMH